MWSCLPYPVSVRLNASKVVKMGTVGKDANSAISQALNPCKMLAVVAHTFYPCTAVLSAEEEGRELTESLRAIYSGIRVNSRNRGDSASNRMESKILLPTFPAPRITHTHYRLSTCLLFMPQQAFPSVWSMFIFLYVSNPNALSEFTYL